ncbi:MAG: DUF3098 domain-containing protein [Bacteroidales bacterium]|nr:DUF3098 domain-containing protein [Bacteroidales bacterium]
MATSKNTGNQTAKTAPANAAKQAPTAGEPLNAEKMAITPRGLRLLLVGLIVMVSGYILMIGGGSKDPAVFNYAMFDFRRLVAAPLMILIGVVIEITSIVKVFKK